MTPLEQLRVEMGASNVPALLVTDLPNIGWLTGFTGSAARVIVTKDNAVFVTDSRYTIQAGEQVPSMEVVSFATPKDGDEFLSEQAKRLSVDTLAFEAATLPYGAYEKLATKLEGITLVPAKDVFSKLRLVKTPEEIEKIREACKLADATFDYLIPRIQPGRSEFDLGLDLEFFIRKHRADLAFTPIVVSGERSARPHGSASEKILAGGDFLTLDFGARLDGYNSDITRTVVVGKATDRHREIYEQVLKAQLASLEAMRPGVFARDVDKLSRTILDEKDLSKYFGHGLGHGLGRVVHDAGRLNSTSEDVLAVGQVWTIEPGVYIPGFGGVRIEDDVVVTEQGIDILTSSTKKLLELG